MSVIYLYDGTFEGLITSVYDGFYSETKPTAIIDSEKYIPTFFDKSVTIYTDQIKAGKVIEAIRSKLGEAVLETVMYAFFL